MTDVSQKGGVRKPQITHKTKKCTKFLKSRELAQIKKCTVFNHGAVFNLKDKKTFRCSRLGLGASILTTFVGNSIKFLFTMDVPKELFLYKPACIISQ